MEKQILLMLLFVVASVAIFASYNIYQLQRMENGMSDLMLANVEALATGEGIEITCSSICSGGIRIGSL